MTMVGIRSRQHERPNAGDTTPVLKVAGVEQIFSEKVSCIAAKRPELAAPVSG